MPELPEVEVVRRGLADHVVGRRITTASFTGARVARRHVPGPADLADRIAGSTVLQARRRGKYLWLVLAEDRDETDRESVSAIGLIAHLGMSGQLLVESSEAPDEKHLHARFTFADGDPELRFVDQRTFGGFALDELGDDGVPHQIRHIAPDPFETAYDQAAVVRRIKASDSAVKRMLLHQGVVSGVGNIYADEALWRAQVHGERPGSSLTKPTISRILDHARDVMAAALLEGGTSFDALYVNVNGASGYFDRSLHAYGQEGEPCDRCGTPIRREQFMNRSSFSCPRCQPRPRGSRPTTAR
ncbi:bifunctional DNA-formamidopyrimidine glycosylase/DNA-(apurinic or apyrimidinic site) lyase [Knoellia sp. LjRoot47]|uniref:bifunctional DNA-formamidopyrimidine glycosylase/DNA-(apurinic or apyrimidinic site) lyase n=1 Tax=Knoellia sp. LjRoot47 TaxID=3342330 RepID=UPI003ECE292F